MMKTRGNNREVADSFMFGHSMVAGNLSTNGLVLWSYQLPIAVRLTKHPTNPVLKLDKGPSVTTNRHLSLVPSAAFAVPHLPMPEENSDVHKEKHYANLCWFKKQLNDLQFRINQTRNLQSIAYRITEYQWVYSRATEYKNRFLPDADVALAFPPLIKDLVLAARLELERDRLSPATSAFIYKLP